MKCPEHNDVELRVEYGSRDADPGLTGYCGKCLKHWPLCTATRFMTPCDLLKNHVSSHMSKDGKTWTT